MILDPNSLLYLLVTSLGPPVVTVALGGLFAHWLVPRWQWRTAEARAVSERRVAILEEIADSFPRYTAAWRRLIQITRLETERLNAGSGLTEPEATRKQAFVEQRNAARDTLCSALSRARIYFDRETWEVIEAFLIWDEANAVRRLDELPEPKEWGAWEARVIDTLKASRRR